MGLEIEETRKLTRLGERGSGWDSVEGENGGQRDAYGEGGDAWRRPKGGFRTGDRAIDSPARGGTVDRQALSRAISASAFEQRLQRRRSPRVDRDRFLLEPQVATRKLSHESRSLAEVDVLGPHAR